MPQRVPDGFQWDSDKAEKNLLKHGLAFEDAVMVFDGTTYDVPDFRMAEFRVRSIGLVHGLEITVVYTVRGRDYRIISARRANRHEREAYRTFCQTPQ